MKRFVFIFACMALILGTMQAQTKAFPTAEGFGATATGGRGGQVVEVTTLLDDVSGTLEGSLRWALKQYPSEPLTVVFRVSGIIDLVGGKSGELRCKRDNYTIAGQTAPGDGICIRGNKVNFGGSNNMILRHIRFRVGYTTDPATGELETSGKGSIGIENASNWIIDHCTFGWSGEENMTIYDNKNTTIQWSIIHEGLYQAAHLKGARGYGTQWGGQNVTFHHNLLAHNYNRSPRFNGARSNDQNVLIDYVNNVNYNWGKANSCYGSDVENVSNRTNFVNNYYKPGPARPGTSSSYFTQSSYGGSASKVAKWYMHGNYIEGTANKTKNTNNYLGLDMSPYPANVRSDSTLFVSTTPFEITSPVTTETAQEAYINVLERAGAFPRDTVDRRIVHEVRTGTASGSGSRGTKLGIIDDPDAVGGYPEYKTYDEIVDNDHDGMDDAWETANGLNPENASDRNLMTESGYTVLEVYLNSLVGEEIPLIFSSVQNLDENKNLSLTISGSKLHVSSVNSSAITVNIYDVAGKQVACEKLLNNTSLDVSSLLSGNYIAEAADESHTKKVLKFNKN